MRVRTSPRRFKPKLNYAGLFRPASGFALASLSACLLVWSVRENPLYNVAFTFEMKENGPGASGPIAIWFSTASRSQNSSLTRS